jgi:hypothetical protein
MGSDRLKQDRFFALRLDEGEYESQVVASTTRKSARGPFSLWVRSRGWKASSDRSSSAARRSSAVPGFLLTTLRAALTRADERNSSRFMPGSRT